MLPKKWITDIILSIIGIVTNVAGEDLVAKLLELFLYDPKVNYESSSLGITITAPLYIYVVRGFALLLSIPLFLNLTKEITFFFLLGLRQRSTKEKLRRFVEYLSMKDKGRRFLGKIYLQRAACPVIEFGKKETPTFLMLIRGLEEVRSYEAGRDLPYLHFERLQETDYQRLFESVRESYYVTSYGDHNVWVILEESDLKYYAANYRRNEDLKKNIINIIKARMHKLRFETTKIERTPGIHRLFILDQDDQIVRAANNGLFMLFKNGLNGFLDKQTQPNPFSALAMARGIDLEHGDVDSAKKKFKSDSITQLFFIILAAKIHDKLKIEFSVINQARIGSRLKHLCLSSQDDLCSGWYDIGWNRLGSAMLDDFMVVHADMQKNQEAIINYKFRPGKVEDFGEAARYFLTDVSYKGFNSINGLLKTFIEDHELTDISERLSTGIREWRE